MRHRNYFLKFLTNIIIFQSISINYINYKLPKKRSIYFNFKIEKHNLKNFSYQPTQMSRKKNSTLEVLKIIHKIN